MITSRHLTTIRAALLFWEEEICPHDREIMLPYFDAPNADPLSGDEVAHLRTELKDTTIRYSLYNRDRRQLSAVTLFDSPDQATAENPMADVVVVVVPAITE